MSKIFISYRRSDSQDITNRIYDRLRASFGAENIFKDVDSIPGGVDFRTAIGQALNQCQVMIVVIGPTWMSTADQVGRPRLYDPKDFVRQEIEGALSRSAIRVLPLLVRGATMPGENQLPSSLAQLTYQNARPIDNDINFHHDMERVIKDVARFVPLQTPAQPQVPVSSGTPSPQLQSPASLGTQPPLQATLAYPRGRQSAKRSARAVPAPVPPKMGYFDMLSWFFRSTGIARTRPIWTQGFLWLFLSTASAGGTAAFLALGGVPVGVPLVLEGLLLLSIGIVCFVFFKSRLLRAAVILQLCAALTGFILLALLSARVGNFLADVCSGCDYELANGAFYLLVIEGVLNTVCLIGLSFGVARWAPTASSRTLLPIVACVGTAGTLLFLLMGGLESDRGDLQGAVLIGTVFALSILLLRPHWRKQHGDVTLSLILGAIFFFFYASWFGGNAGISSVRQFIQPVAFWLLVSETTIVLGLLLLIQAERVQRLTQQTGNSVP